MTIVERLRYELAKLPVQTDKRERDVRMQWIKSLDQISPGDLLYNGRPLTAPSPPANPRFTHMEATRIQHWLEQARASVLSARDDAEIKALIALVGER